MSSEPDVTNERIDTDDGEDLVGVAGLGVLGAGRDDDEREQTAERLEHAGRPDGHGPTPRRGGTPAPDLARHDQDGSSTGGLTRRGTLAALGGLGVLGLGSQSASAASGDHLGENWNGDPSSHYGLRIEATSDTRFGIMGFSNETKGRGILGRAYSTTGTTRGLSGRVDSHTDGAAALAGRAAASSGRTYGFIGRSDSTEGVGAFALAPASSGSTLGMEGRSASDSGTGVLGNATASSGATTGVEGKTQSSNSNAVAVRADAPNGGVGLQASTSGNLGVEVNTTDYTGINATVTAEGYNAVEGYQNATSGYSWGVRGDTDSASGRAHGVKGFANATSGSGNGVSGTTYGDGDGASGVHGEATASSGRTYGVHGETSSEEMFTAGAKGHAKATSGRTYGVHGATNSSEDYAIGAKGEAKAASGKTFGVKGLTGSSDDGATGVRGRASTASTGEVYGVKGTTDADANPGTSTHPVGVYGQTNGDSRTFGVRGEATSSGGTGIYGQVAPASFERVWNDSYPTGITGLTNYSGADPNINGSAGVEGVANASSGSNIGVLGVTYSSDGYGVYSSGDMYTSGDLETSGSHSVGDTGLSAYLDTQHQEVTSGTNTIVVFDTINTDDFAGMDTSTGIYTVQEDGDYHVSFTIDWNHTFDAGDDINYELLINGSANNNQGFSSDTSAATTGQQVCESFSRTVFNLTSGDTLAVQVYQNSGSPKEIFGDNQDTYLTIYKVG